VIVRRLRITEADVLKRLRLSMLRGAPSAYGTTYEEACMYDEAEWDARTQRGAEAHDSITYVVEIDGTPVGMTGGAIEEGTAHLYAMWVEPEARRSGAGRALVEAVVEWARGKRASVMELEATEGNVAACALYEGCGFSDTGERRPLREGSTTNTIIMRRTLDA
jgi:ribosomal protein S18 acetylase RimI-like enzyme